MAGLNQFREFDLDGHVDAKGVRYIGKAVLQPSGLYHVMAVVGGALCWVEVTIKHPGLSRIERLLEPSVVD